MSVRPGFHAATVIRREQLSDHLVRIVLGGLEGFVSTGIPDEWVALVVPGQFQSRYYTVRSWVDGEMTLDIVMHEEGLVTEWAASDCVGDLVSISDPKGSFLPAPDTEWIVLMGDLSALPAMARISATTSVSAYVVSADGPIEGYLPDAVWLPGDASIADFVASFDFPAGRGYFWMSGESGEMREIRRFVRKDLGWDASRYDLMGYWSNSRGRRLKETPVG